MESCSVSSLAFRGSIPEAILEAKNQKKLFVVYISGEDGESARLEESTWVDSKVAESISKYCVLLHLSEASTNAAQFSALYPQNSVPSITAIGYNGIKVWQNDGFVNAENLASTLEKTWLSLHIQETTASFLTAAITSKNAEPSASEGSSVPSSDQQSSSSINSKASAVSFNQDSSSSANVPLVAAQNHIEFTNSSALGCPSITEDINHESTAKQKKSSKGQTSMESSDSVVSGGGVKEKSSDFTGSLKGSLPPVTEDSKSSQENVNSSKAEVLLQQKNFFKGQTSMESSDSGVLGGGVKEKSSDFTGPLKGSLPPVTEDSNSSRENVNLSKAEGDSLSPEVKSCEQTSPSGGSKKSVEKNEGVSDRDETLEDKKLNALDSSTVVYNSNDIYLNIRFPNGVGLQEKFSMTSALRMVKDYVDANEASGNGSYDLAIPYPRRVFSDQDFSKSLSELGLLNRQSLIVVPHRGIHPHTGPQSSDLTDFSSDDDDYEEDERESGGYFAYVKKFISFLNPFSYVSDGTSSSNSGNGSDSDSSTWQYGPNAAVQYNSSSTGRPDSFYVQNPTTSGEGRSAGQRGRPAARFGSNIHTLRHDEDDDRFGNRNAFWNGNSTQFGGDSDQR